MYRGSRWGRAKLNQEVFEPRPRDELLKECLEYVSTGGVQMEMSIPLSTVTLHDGVVYIPANSPCRE
jgi:hypothetical protein